MGQDFEGHAEVLAEEKSLPDLNHIDAPVFISLFDVSENPVLDLSLAVRSLFVFNDLKCHLALHLMIICAVDLAKGTPPKLIKDLVTIRHVVVNRAYVVAFLIVKSKVIVPLILFRRVLTQEIHELVLKYLCLLKEAQMAGVLP